MIYSMGPRKIDTASLPINQSQRLTGRNCQQCAKSAALKSPLCQHEGPLHVHKENEGQRLDYLLLDVGQRQTELL